MITSFNVGPLPCCGGYGTINTLGTAVEHKCTPQVIRGNVCVSKLPDGIYLRSAVVPQALEPVLPTDHAERNALPMCTGCLDYFPLALAEVAKLSAVANEQHNPGEPVHWARGKSTEHRDKILKHLVDSGTMDADGMRHSAKIAWRALALLQEEMEAAGGRPGRGSKFPTGDIVK